MEAFLISSGVVALAEIGDKTQLLALLLAVRFKKPYTIILAILLATIANHALAGLLGTWLTTLLPLDTLRWVLGISFILMAGWLLIPDKLDASDARAGRHLGVFGTTLLMFFLAEMGDKTQIATVMLAAQYQTFIPVVLGTTLGMMIANVPVVFAGEQLAQRIPVRLVHIIAAVIFWVLGLLTLLGEVESMGL
jgi:putative Ca2+/H+ antiporter (TMEM165/GDT1 family)